MVYQAWFHRGGVKVVGKFLIGWYKKYVTDLNNRVAKEIQEKINQQMEEAVSPMTHAIERLNYLLEDSQKDRKALHLKDDELDLKIDNHEVRITVLEDWRWSSYRSFNGRKNFSFPSHLQRLLKFPEDEGLLGSPEKDGMRITARSRFSGYGAFEASKPGDYRLQAVPGPSPSNPGLSGGNFLSAQNEKSCHLKFISDGSSCLLFVNRLKLMTLRKGPAIYFAGPFLV